MTNLVHAHRWLYITLSYNNSRSGENVIIEYDIRVDMYNIILNSNIKKQFIK